MSLYDTAQLTEQEIVNLRRLTTDPGFQVIIKLLQSEINRSTAEAMANKDPDPAARLLSLTDAQAVHGVVDRLIAMINAHLRPMPEAPKVAEGDPLDFSMFNGRTN